MSDENSADGTKGTGWLNVFRVFILGKSMPQRAESITQAAIAALKQFESEQTEEVTRILLIAEDARKQDD